MLRGARICRRDRLRLLLRRLFILDFDFDFDLDLVFELEFELEGLLDIGFKFSLSAMGVRRLPREDILLREGEGESSEEDDDEM